MNHINYLGCIKDLLLNMLYFLEEEDPELSNPEAVTQSIQDSLTRAFKQSQSARQKQRLTNSATQVYDVIKCMYCNVIKWLQENMKEFRASTAHAVVPQICN